MASSACPASILVVDDEPDMCWALENILSPEGYQIATATSGKKALELANEKRFEVVFIDAKLPDVDGLELSSRIKETNPRGAIVMISGFFYREDEAIDERLENELCVSFISKPFDLDEVRLAAKEAVAMARHKR